MVGKIVFEQLLHHIRYGQVTVEYWDGQVRHFGTDGPHLKAKVLSPAMLRAIPFNASLAIGEAYMHGQLLIDDLAVLFELIAKNHVTFQGKQPALRQRNRRGRQQSQIAHHYDVGNDYYRLFLDPTLTYSCAYFQHKSDSLEQAQHQKFEHILRKMRLQPGQRMLDIGSGWGHLAVTAAKQYKAEVLGITLSEEQLRGARQLAKREGVADKVRFKLMNYQEVKGQFDRVVSVGMFEHVGRGQHATYFEKVIDLLSPGGVSLLHTITAEHDQPIDAWIDKYIFPGGHLPTVAGIEEQLAQHDLWSIDRENLWQHYAMTLNHWAKAHKTNRKQIIDMYDETFYRMREFWLHGSEGAFRWGDLGLAQVVFTKGKPGDWPLTRSFMTKS